MKEYKYNTIADLRQGFLKQYNTRKRKHFNIFQGYDSKYYLQIDKKEDLCKDYLETTSKKFNEFLNNFDDFKEEHNRISELIIDYDLTTFLNNEYWYYIVSESLNKDEDEVTENEILDFLLSSVNIVNTGTMISIQNIIVIDGIIFLVRL